MGSTRRLTGHGGRGRLGVWTRLCVIASVSATRGLLRPRWIGLEHVPPTGGVILVVNHLSQIDPVTVAAFGWDAGRLPRFMVKDSVFGVPVVGTALRHARQIPVHRGTAQAHIALRAAAQALRDGELVVVYPEGTVTRDPNWWPMQAKTGLARLWLDTGAPVVPVAQWGQHRVLDYHTRRLRLLPRKNVVVRAGAPVDLSAFGSAPVSQRLLRDITDTVFAAVRDLLADERGEPAPERFWTLDRRAVS